MTDMNFEPTTKDEHLALVAHKRKLLEDFGFDVDRAMAEAAVDVATQREAMIFALFELTFEDQEGKKLANIGCSSYRTHVMLHSLMERLTQILNRAKDHADLWGPAEHLTAAASIQEVMAGMAVYATIARMIFHTWTQVFEAEKVEAEKVAATNAEA